VKLSERISVRNANGDKKGVIKKKVVEASRIRILVEFEDGSSEWYSVDIQED